MWEMVKCKKCIFKIQQGGSWVPEEFPNVGIVPSSSGFSEHFLTESDHVLSNLILSTLNHPPFKCTKSYYKHFTWVTQLVVRLENWIKPMIFLIQCLNRGQILKKWSYIVSPLIKHVRLLNICKKLNKKTPKLLFPN